MSGNQYPSFPPPININPAHNSQKDFNTSMNPTNQWSMNQSNEFENREKYMETELTEENYAGDSNSNANQSEAPDDGPFPPPGLRRLVTGQTVSFDDVPASPPFDRIIPGEGNTFPNNSQATKISKPAADNGIFERFVSGSATKEHTSTFQPFIPPLPTKKDNSNQFGNSSFIDNATHNSTTPENYLRPNNSSHDAENIPKVNQFPKNKFASLPSGFQNYDAEKREAYYQSVFNDDLSIKSGASSFQNYPSRPSSHISPEVLPPLNRTRNDAYFEENNRRRYKDKDSVNIRYEINRKKPIYDRRDRRKIESEDEDYEESVDRNYDDSPDRESRSYRDKHYRNSPRRSFKRPSRRERESSYTQSQDESYYDDEEDDYDSFKNQRRYYERNYRDKREEYSSRYEDDHYYRDGRNSRPSSRTGSEYWRDFADYNTAKKRYQNRPVYYQYLDHRRIIHNAGGSRMLKREIDYWSNVREVDPKKYMNWFKITYPKEYTEWYSTYVTNKIGQPSGTYQTDRRGSGHSGQSSVNNDTINVGEEKMLENNQDRFYKPMKNKVSKVQEKRSSPAKFTLPHIKGVFNSLGQLVVVNPCSPQDEQLADVDIYQVLPKIPDSDFAEFLNFTGPFIVGETHVNTLSDFVRRHANRASSNSEKLLYLLIDLIIKLRGVTDGIAISELLMENYRKSQKLNLSSLKEDTKTEDCVSHLSETEIIETYSSLLLQGDKNAALDWAINNKLWGHAFLLAFKVGPKYYGKVLAKFDSSISMNNPLKTLYQLYSKQIPQAATACADEKWGDWRPHLAMILSNPTSDTEFDKTAVVTLGDSLSSKDVFAAHFCYLAAQLDFESPDKPAAKYSLLTLRNGVDCFGVKASNHSILLTQIYEFAKRLQKNEFTISSLMPYSYLLAVRLIDYGKTLVALQYLESIASNLIRNTCEVDQDLAYNVLELAEKLKYSDAKPLDLDSSVEKQWFINLRQIVEYNSNIVSQPIQNEQLLMTNSSSQHSEPFSTQPVIGQQYSQVEMQQPFFNEILPVNQPLRFQPIFSSQNQQTRERRESQPWESSLNEKDQENKANRDYSYSQDQFNPLPKSNEFLDINDNLLQQTHDQYNQATSDSQYYSPWDPPQQSISISSHSNYSYFDLEDSKKPESNYVSKSAGLSNNMLKKYGMTYNFSHRTNNVKLYQVKRLHRWGTKPIKKYVDFTNENISRNKKYEIAHLNDQIIGNSSFRGDFADDDVYDFYRSMYVVRYNSLCNSKIVFNGTFPIDKPFGIRKSLSGGQTNSENSGNQDGPSKQPVRKNSDGNGGKEKLPDGNGGSWLGGIFGKLSLRPKNEMKLPDDKNPSIVWNEEKRKWVNVDEGDNDSAIALKPPIKDSELRNSYTLSHGLGEMIPSSNAYSAPEVNKSPSNIYKLQKGKGMKANYVNVLSPSTAPSNATQKAMIDPFSNKQVPSNTIGRP